MRCAEHLNRKSAVRSAPDRDSAVIVHFAISRVGSRESAETIFRGLAAIDLSTEYF